MNCKICSSSCSFWGEGRILYKYDIKYYKCSNCAFIQTEQPYWLEESYADAINRSDVGYVYRNIQLSRVTKFLIKLFFKRRSKFLDYGAGYGLFVRMMRDLGYNFFWMDKYCQNIFANDFEGEEKKGYELVTGFELFEHLVDPMQEVKAMLEYSDSIFFSTVLVPSSLPKPGEWWYYGLDHGQHVALYSRSTFDYIAKKFGLNFYSNGKNLHLLSKKKINSVLFKLVDLYNIYVRVTFFPLKSSLLEPDYQMVVAKIKKEQTAQVSAPNA